MPEKEKLSEAEILFRKGVECWSTSSQWNLRNALQYFESASQKGHLEAKLWAGYLYLYGLPQIQVNVEFAKKYLEQASERGLALATHFLFVLSFPKKMRQSLEYAQKAFAQGYLYEANFLCDAYLYGWGTEIDIHKAIEYNACARTIGLPNAETKYLELLCPHFFSNTHK